MSSFFTAPASQRKRKRQDQTSSSSAKRVNASKRSGAHTRSRPARRTVDRSESISGSGSGSDLDDERAVGGPAPGIENSDSDSQDETAAEKRLRLAEQYLENVRQEVDEAGFDAAEIDKDLIAQRLKEDVAESSGKLYRHIARKLAPRQAAQAFFRADQTDVTCLACCAPYVYTAAKDMSVVKWEIPQPPEPSVTANGVSNGTPQRGSNFTPPRRPKKLAYARGRRSKNPSYLGHTSTILCAAASTTGRFLATGGLDRRLVIWDVSSRSSLKPVKVFTQHRDAVTGVAFRRGTNQLFSCSRDRTVKVWSLDELAYVETLFGHQDSVVGVASLAKEVCVSIGSRDRTARLWKVGEETQLVFRGGGVPGKSKSQASEVPAVNGFVDHQRSSSSFAKHGEGSIDSIALVDDDTFLTGADNGSISLWNIHKKKPVAIIPLAHGEDPPMPLEDSFAEQDLAAKSGKKHPAPPGPRWITALATIPYSDVALSGSWDGTVKAWRIGEDRRTLEPLGVVKVEPIDARGHGHLDETQSGSSRAICGIVNDIVAFENGERGKAGISIVAAVGKEHRLGRWRSYAKKSTAVWFSVPRESNGPHLNGFDPDEESS